MASKARLVTITTAEGDTQDGILLSPAPGGEDSASPLVFVLDRGGEFRVVEAAQGADADSYVEA